MDHFPFVTHTAGRGLTCSLRGLTQSGEAQRSPDKMVQGRMKDVWAGRRVCGREAETTRENENCGVSSYDGVCCTEALGLYPKSKSKLPSIC